MGKKELLSWIVEKLSKSEKDTYVSADYRVLPTPEKAIEASLNFEKASNTGVGCSQGADKDQK